MEYILYLHRISLVRLTYRIISKCIDQVTLSLQDGVSFLCILMTLVVILTYP